MHSTLQLDLWDENSTPLRWNLSLGVIGSVPLPSRSRDRFGPAWFQISPSSFLRDALADPAPKATNTPIFLGLRTMFRF